MTEEKNKLRSENKRFTEVDKSVGELPPAKTKRPTFAVPTVKPKTTQQPKKKKN